MMARTGRRLMLAIQEQGNNASDNCCKKFNAVTRPCDSHAGNPDECPDVLVIKHNGFWGLKHPDGFSYFPIERCPFCGANK
jgi:hypothetical protein